LTTIPTNRIFFLDRKPNQKGGGKNMASLKGPLFSLSASGAIAKTLVYGSWKGVKTVRQHVDPANPQTAQQIAQRALITAAVSAWKNYFTGAEGRAAWNRWALNDSRPMSGFNGFVSQVAPIIATDSDASYVSAMTEQANQLIDWTLLNIDDGAQADEAGNFDVWTGATISGMTLSEQIALVGGDLVGTIDEGDAADEVYCKVRKDSYDRSGIFIATLL